MTFYLKFLDFKNKRLKAKQKIGNMFSDYGGFMNFFRFLLSILLLALLPACASYYPNSVYSGRPSLPDASYPGYYVYQNYPAPQAYSDDRNLGYTGMGEQNVQFGRVESIRPLYVSTQSTPRTSGAGAAIGAIVGGVLLNQIFKNTGGSRRGYYGRGYGYRYHDNTRDVATIGGAIAGGLIGNNFERNQTSNMVRGEEVVVQLENGQYISVTQNDMGSLYVGQLVRVVGNGSRARVYPDR